MPLELFENVGNASAFSFPKYAFGEQWINQMEIQRCSIADIKGFVSAHYLHAAPAVVVLALKLTACGVPIGCVIFSMPPRETCKRYGGLTWELARLYLINEVPGNSESWLISAAVKYVKKNHKEVECLVSYADPDAGHDGRIYRASNWVEDGRMDEGRKTPRLDYLDSQSRRFGRRAHSKGPLVHTYRHSKFRFFVRLR